MLESNERINDYKNESHLQNEDYFEDLKENNSLINTSIGNQSNSNKNYDITNIFRENSAYLYSRFTSKKPNFL